MAARPGKTITIRHAPSGEVIAQGPKGWGITPFEGNYYVRRKYLRAGRFHLTPVPGLCPYKGLYLWLRLDVAGRSLRGSSWLYWLPNPLLPMIWFRVAVSGNHPDLSVRIVEDAHD